MVAVLVKHDPLLVVLLGPTASGKTSLSLTLAERFNGEIINCDSVAVYCGMEIGTAKPSPDERARVPHHIIDIYSPDEHSTAGDYARRAREAIRDIASRDRLPIVTGGTGLYLRALLQGLFAGPQRSQEIRARLERSHSRHVAGWLHRLLTRLDPASAERIHANDVPKLIRAIEVSLAARRPMSEAWREGREPLRGFRILRIGLDPPRPALYQRINDRAARMFEDGLIEETRVLIGKYGESMRAFDSLGYRQARAVLRGQISLQTAVAAAQQGHRNYAKRQLTWFRREPDVHWLQGFGDDQIIVAQAMNLVAEQLSGR
ncbi:MAG TPA: tRNA (adenosine(37)-N6)-dimethylallyltransferase MiaA [Acidobacteriaceae bacterium]|nr:tRNA (adenosine(37)-N6)-dimethylallyltransferase MiaA [Acidobacteriaceae bacterium]